MLQKLTDFAVRMRSLSKRTRVFLTVLVVLAGMYAAALQLFSTLLEREETLYSYNLELVSEVDLDAPLYAAMQKQMSRDVACTMFSTNFGP